MFFSSMNLLFLAFFAGLWSIWRFRSKYGKNGMPMPPGPGGFPVFGSLHMLGRLPHRSLQKLSHKYGPIMSIRLGQVQAIVVSSPEFIEFFFKTHDLVCANRLHDTEASKHISYGQKSLLFSPYTPSVQNTRKLLTVHLLSKSKLEMFKPMLTQEVENFIHSIQVAAQSQNSTVDISARVGSVIEDITFQMLFGFKDDRYNLKSTIQESLALSGAVNIADFIPCLGPLDLQGLRRKMINVKCITDEFLEKMISEHERNAKDVQGQHRDFIDVILSLRNSTDTQERENIKANVLDILTGSLDTTSVIIEWTVSELLRHPRVMKLVQEELKDKVGLHRLVEEEDLDNLKYLKMVIKESMRLHAPPPFLYRTPMEDLTINGYCIPKNSRIIINIWAMARDPNVWSDNAEEFYPERFLETSTEPLGHDFRFLPFGSGRRICPAWLLGSTLVELIVAQLTHCFNLQLPNGISPTDLDMSERFGLTSPRVNHLFAVPTYRVLVK
ncbi:hypothetical protein ACHQM5_025502 [Ranunculus cassubicifolius]